MRWLMFSILAYFALGIQGGLAIAMPDGVRLNLMLLVVIFVTVNAPREYGLLAAFMLGMLQDLFTGSPMGLWAFSYGIVGMFVVSTQEYVYKAHPLTNISLALVGGIITTTIAVIEAWVHHRHLSLMPLAKGVFYLSVLSPIVLGLLDRGKKAFGFRSRSLGSMRVSRAGPRV